MRYDEAERQRLGLCPCCYRRHRHRVALIGAAVILVSALVVATVVSSIIQWATGWPNWLATMPTGLALVPLVNHLHRSIRADW